MPARDSYLVPPHPFSPGAQENFPSVPGGVWRKAQTRAGNGIGQRSDLFQRGLAWACRPHTGGSPLLTDGLFPCHQLQVTAEHRWLLQAGRQGSLSQSAHTKSLCRTAGCQHGQGKVQGSLTGLSGKHPSWGHCCTARPQLEGKPSPAQ